MRIAIGSCFCWMRTLEKFLSTWSHFDRSDPICQIRRISNFFTLQWLNLIPCTESESLFRLRTRYLNSYVHWNACGGSVALQLRAASLFASYVSQYFFLSVLYFSNPCKWAWTAVSRLRVHRLETQPMSISHTGTREAVPTILWTTRILACEHLSRSSPNLFRPSWPSGWANRSLTGFGRKWAITSFTVLRQLASTRSGILLATRRFQQALLLCPSVCTVFRSL